MINITFPDGSVRQFAKGTTGQQIAESISSRLAQEVLSISVTVKRGIFPAPSIQILPLSCINGTMKKENTPIGTVQLT